MIWLDPWAWAGVVAVGVPVLVHLLGRDRAPRRSFPTLRFVEAIELLPTRRTRVHDIMLLIVRMAIVFAAVAALAQPVLFSGRTSAADARVARVIIVDTSASMTRATPSGESAVAAARREATRLAAEARPSIVVETAQPGQLFAGVSAWLDKQPSRRELVIVSDFQSGVMDSADVAKVSTGTGIRLARIDAVGRSAIEQRLRAGDIEIHARLDSAGGHASVEWSSARVADDTTQLGAPALLAGASEVVRATAALAAASTVPVALPIDTGIATAVVYPGFAERPRLLRDARPIRSARLLNLVDRIRADPTLRDAARDEIVAAPNGPVPTNALVLAKNREDVALAVATEDSLGGRARLLLVSLADAGSLTSAALIASTRRALSIAAPVAESDPSRISDTVLASWQRAPAVARAAGGMDPATSPSDARWLWLLVLALLALETWMRRATPARVAEPVTGVSDRAA